MSIIDAFLSTVLRTRLGQAAANERNGVFCCTEKNSFSSWNFFASVSNNNVASPKQKHVLLGLTRHDASDPLRGSGEKQKQTGGRCQRGIRHVPRSGGAEASRKSDRSKSNRRTSLCRTSAKENEASVSRYRPVKRVGNDEGPLPRWRPVDRRSDFSGEAQAVKAIERAELLTVKAKTKEKEKKTDDIRLSTILSSFQQCNHFDTVYNVLWRRRRSSSVEHGVSLDKYRAKW